LIDFKESGRNGGDFSAAIDKHNGMILRSILVPKHLGFDETAGGSYALGKVNFDVFAWVVLRLRQELEVALNEQLIRQMTMLNFPNVDKFPTFKFNPLTEEDKDIKAKTIISGLQSGALQMDLETENFLRGLLGLPDVIEVAEKEPVDDKLPPKPDEDDEEDEEEDAPPKKEYKEKWEKSGDELAQEKADETSQGSVQAYVKNGGVSNVNKIIADENIYNKTQEKLKADGVKNVTLYKAVDFNYKLDEDSESQGMGNKPKAFTYKPRGSGSSWTSDIDVAEEFVAFSDKDQAIIKAIVPAKQVSACYKVFRKSWAAEKEYVVKGSVKGAVLYQ
jgi:hypothetical protein